ncbi:MAG: hypothetical protein HC865_23450 [Cyanobacteria bacterium RU_5_0]|nr:hypothetical protein [Cyanobacteria bacterium RU_5_0]
MTELVKDAVAIDVTDLLTRYSFDLGGYTTEQLVDSWLDRYPTQWIRLATIEALYQGRYKAVSVEQLLSLWQRRGRSLHRFNREFERIVCNRFFSSVIDLPTTPAPSSSRIKTRIELPKQPIDPPPIAPAMPATDEPINPFPSLEEMSDGRVTASEEPKAPIEAIEMIEAVETVEAVEAIDSPMLNPESDLLAPSSEMALPNPDEDLDSSLPPLHRQPVQTFKPVTASDLQPLLEINWSRSTAAKHPIHQFVPQSESSDFHAKLKAVAQGISVSENHSAPTAVAEPEVERGG